MTDIFVSFGARNGQLLSSIIFFTGPVKMSLILSLLPLSICLIH